MNHLTKKLLLSLALGALTLGAAGCVGYVDDGYYNRPGYYGRDRWYHDGPWMDGPRGYIGVEIAPPVRSIRLPSPPNPFGR